MRLFPWKRQKEEFSVVEDLRKVAYLQGQLDNTITQLQSAICELHGIIDQKPEEGSDEPVGR